MPFVVPPPALPCLALLVFLLLTGCTSPKNTPPPQAGQNPSPMVDYTRAHERIEESTYAGQHTMLDDLLDRPVAVYLPEAAQAADSVTVLIHFHGAGYIPMHAVYHAEAPYLLAVVNLGSGSSVYERPFTDPATLSRLLAAMDSTFGQQMEAPPHRAGVYLSAFSAGYGAVRALLRNDTTFAIVDGVLLLDGLHTDYVPARTTLAAGGRLDSTKMAPFLRLARAAIQGEKRFLFTHSEIFPGTYASTTETADFLLQHLGLQRTPVLRWGPVGMQQVSEAGSGRFAILGFAGNTAPDHVDHVHALPDLLAMLAR